MTTTRHQVNFHTLNNLLAYVTRSDPRTVEHVRSAVNFTLENALPGGPDEDTLLASAEHLVRLHQIHDPDRMAFQHLDLRSEEYDPLFLRAHVRSVLRLLAGTPEAILLITGLRRMICPPGRNWTQKRHSQYEEAKSFIEDVAAQCSTTNTRLHLLFL